MLIGNDNTTLGDREIGSDMLKDSKFAVLSLGQAITEIVNTELRQILAAQLTAAVNNHYQLSDMLVRKEWYKPYLSPQQQMSGDLKMAQIIEK